MDQLAKLKLQILTPVKKFLDEEIDMVTIPAQEGEMGILPGHIAMIAALSAGLVRIYQGGAVVRTIFVHGGFVKIDNEQVIMLIEEALDKMHIDYNDALSHIKEIESKLMNSDDPEYKKLLSHQLHIYQRMAEASK